MSAPNRIVIMRCPHHGTTAISFDDDSGSGDRVTPWKCCGLWRETKSWKLSAYEWRKVESLAREAAEALEKEAPKADVHDLAREKGWWDGYERDDQGRLILSTDQVISKIALIHAELSEAVEEARKSNDYGMYLGQGGKPEGFVVELADAVIRTLDLCGALGLDLEAAIVTKHEFNKTRPRRHGGKLA